MVDLALNLTSDEIESKIETRILVPYGDSSYSELRAKRDVLRAKAMKDHGIKELWFPSGYQILVKTYIRSGQEEGDVLFTGDDFLESDKHLSSCGYVIDFGHLVFRGRMFEWAGPYCEIGDCIKYNKYASPNIHYDGIDYHSIVDEQVIGSGVNPKFLKLNPLAGGQ